MNICMKIWIDSYTCRNKFVHDLKTIDHHVAVAQATGGDVLVPGQVISYEILGLIF